MKKITQKNNIEIRSSNENIDYKEAIKYMENRVENILNNNEKELIWFLNHSNIYTKGTNSKDGEIINNSDIPIIQSNRGGKITYHGPGQRIVYFIINLNKRKKDIRSFVNLIENSAIKLLKEIDIQAKTYPERVGIWVTGVKKHPLHKEKKIGAIGLRLKKWITFHGLSFNINPNLNYYNNIDACGLKNYSATSVKDLGIKLPQDLFDKIYLENFINGLKDF